MYDFYNFPNHYVSATIVTDQALGLLLMNTRDCTQYKVKLHAKNPSNLSKTVIDHLQAKGIKVVPTRRGIDHGVFVPFKVAFGLPYPESGESADESSLEAALPEGLPLVQVSLPRSEASIDALRLGRALRGLREQGYGIVGSGMPIHNLRDLFARMRAGVTEPSDFAVGFGAALSSALVGAKVDAKDERGNGDNVDAAPEERWNEALQLEKNKHFRQAHPRPDHFLRE